MPVDPNDIREIEKALNRRSRLDAALVAATALTLAEETAADMALKADLVSGKIPTSQLGSGSAGPTTFLAGDQTYKSPGAGSTVIKQTEVDFGATPVAEASFVVTDGDVSATSNLIGSVAYEAPTGKDLDEIEMDDLILRFGPGVGSFTLFIRAADGSYLHDKFLINYLIG